MQERISLWALGLAGISVVCAAPFVVEADSSAPRRFRVDPAPIATDKSVKYDYDIVYVRVPRKDGVPPLWAEVGAPHVMDSGGDLVLLHPDGTEEVLVEGGADGSIADPYVSFDGEWVYYAHFRGLKQASKWFPSPEGSDIYKVHVKTRKIVRLTEQIFTPNTGAANWSSDYRTQQPGRAFLRYGVINSAPCPLPGGKVMFTSNRNAFRPPMPATSGSITLQLFVMDEDGSNVEQIGYLNLGAAMHPVVLKDGRVMFSTFEHQGLRFDLNWGLWSIHPNGTSWGPIVSAVKGDTFHFQAQLSNGDVVIEEYYNGSNFGFGTFYKLPSHTPDGYAAFGPGFSGDAKVKPLRFLPHVPGMGGAIRLPFQPYEMETLTRFCSGFDEQSALSVPGKKDSARLGKVTHPSAAPDNHLLTVWSPGPVNRNHSAYVDSGIYLLKDGEPINESGALLLIKNDPRYNEQWPRALVPYKRIYGIAEPDKLPSACNAGSLSPHLPEGTPFGLVGTSSLYKRESYPRGRVRPGSVTAEYAGGSDPWKGLGATWSDTDNWVNQGADAGRYSNNDIHAIRILVQEPTTDGDADPNGRRFHNHAKNERLRILGEIPVRKFLGNQQPLDPDGNPDTSFLAKIPADVAWTFQTLDKNGMVLNMAQTWHQLRPGEVRTNCGGCHAHSQKPTEFKDTQAAKPDYTVFDLTERTPLLTSKKNDESGKKWDAENETGLRLRKGVKNVEYFRDIKPILDRSCTTCHSGKADKPAGNLVLDDDQILKGTNVPGTYFRLAMDRGNGGTPVRFGHKPPTGFVWGPPNASRYIRMMQSRRSLLVWKIFGHRTDGFSNDDFIIEAIPGNPNSLQLKGKPVPSTPQNRRRTQLAYLGAVMPPLEAIKGTYKAADGRRIKVAPLGDEDRLTIVRWIDLGCPIDLDYDPARPENRGDGWMCDDQRPTLTLTYPRAGYNDEVTRFLVGMHDYYTGLDTNSFTVVADFPVDGMKPGQNLASRFKLKAPGTWEFRLTNGIKKLSRGKVTVSVKDNHGNLSRIERTLTVGEIAASKSQPVGEGVRQSGRRVE
jgi:hypothetical protein